MAAVPPPALALLALLVAASPPAIAGSVPAALKACMALTSDAERLACFDREMNRLTGAPSPPSAPVGQAASNERAAAAAQPTEARPTSAAQPTPPPAPTPEQRFGNPPPDKKAKAAEPPPLTELSARVASISKRAHGERVLVLDNDQIWVEEEPSPRVLIHVGDRVTIRAGLIGSYRLVASGNAATRVTRLK